eukprot:GHVU01009819.1.p1 GENE.GHVU01009819.1~~GHVU01009819.1.p1  ORF type:complete len:110 (-),score=0.65 GHVU01009819.1:436-765(-)
MSSVSSRAAQKIYCTGRSPRDVLGLHIFRFVQPSISHIRLTASRYPGGIPGNPRESHGPTASLALLASALLDSSSLLRLQHPANEEEEDVAQGHHCHGRKHVGANLVHH